MTGVQRNLLFMLNVELSGVQEEGVAMLNAKSILLVRNNTDIPLRKSVGFIFVFIFLEVCCIAQEMLELSRLFTLISPPIRVWFFSGFFFFVLVLCERKKNLPLYLRFVFELLICT